MDSNGVLTLLRTSLLSSLVGDIVSFVDASPDAIFILSAIFPPRLHLSGRFTLYGINHYAYDHATVYVL